MDEPLAAAAPDPPLTRPPTGGIAGWMLVFVIFGVLVCIGSLWNLVRQVRTFAGAGSGLGRFVDLHPEWAFEEALLMAHLLLVVVVYGVGLVRTWREDPPAPAWWRRGIALMLAMGLVHGAARAIVPGDPADARHFETPTRVLEVAALAWMLAWQRYWLVSRRVNRTFGRQVAQSPLEDLWGLLMRTRGRPVDAEAVHAGADAEEAVPPDTP